MPHKRNPELSEHLATLARVVRADASVAVEGMVHEHERDGRAWKAEWLVLPEACLLTTTAAALGCRLLEGLDVHADRMLANLDAHGGYVLSERLVRVLSDRLGKHGAHQAIYDATMAGIERGATFAEALQSDPTVSVLLDGDDLATYLDPRAALGATGEFVDRVLRAAGGQP